MLEGDQHKCRYNWWKGTNRNVDKSAGRGTNINVDTSTGRGPIQM